MFLNSFYLISLLAKTLPVSFALKAHLTAYCGFRATASKKASISGPSIFLIDGLIMNKMPAPVHEVPFNSTVQLRLSL